MAEQTKAKTKRYATRFGEHYALVMVPTVTEVINGIAMKKHGHRIVFERGIYETSDPDEQKFLESHPRCGTDFKEVTKKVNSALQATTLAEKEAELARKEEELKRREMALKGTKEGAEGGESGEEDIDATDSARQLAEENGIDLSEVEGSGDNGRILKSDVEAVIRKSASEEGEDGKGGAAF